MDQGSLCEHDADCPGVQVCINGNVTWLQTGEKRCYCSPFYGWRNLPACDQIDTGALVMIVVYWVLTALAVGGIISGLSVMFKMVCKEKTCLKLNAGNVTFVLSMISLTCTTVWFVVAALIHMRPEDNDLFQPDFIEGYIKYPQLIGVERLFVVLSLLFGTAAVLNISLMWIKVVVSTKAISGKALDVLGHCRIVVYSSEFLQAAILIPCMIGGIPEIAVFIVTPFYLFIAVVYAFAQRKLVFLLKRIAEFEVTSPTRKEWCIKQIVRVRRTAIMIIVGLIVTLAFGIAFGSMYLMPNGWQEYCRASDRVGPIQVVYAFIPLGNLYVSYVVLCYASTSLLTPARSRRMTAEEDVMMSDFEEDTIVYGQQKGLFDDGFESSNQNTNGTDTTLASGLEMAITST